MFELLTMTKARVHDVRTLARKDRKPDETPGAQLLMSAQLRAANAAGKTPEQALAESVGAPAPGPAPKPVKEWPFPIEPGSNGGPGAKSAPPPAPAKKTAAELAKTGVKSRRGAMAPPVHYRDPDTGQTWSGRGLKPKWLAVQLERGKTLADFEVGKAH